MAQRNIHIPSEEIAEFCRRNRIAKLSLFGSVLRDDFHDGSDVDVLVEFEPGARVGLEFFRMQRELSEIVGRQVDLRTVAEIGTRIRAAVLASVQVVYVH